MIMAPWSSEPVLAFACACGGQYPFGTIFVLPGGEVFQCWDRGGKVTNRWLDLMVKVAPVPYGTPIDVTVYD